MSTNISFDTDNKFKYKNISNQKNESKMVNYLISKGIVKDEKKAVILMWFITLLMFISTFLVIYFFYK